MNNIPDINIDQLIERYSVLLFDSYGVLAGSTGTFPGAVELINHLNRIQKPYFILTNDASALPGTRSDKYAAFGLTVSPDKIITSGSLLKGYFRVKGLQ
ncbi:MAG: haloacid dehalogenase, partial [Chloroflexi bacterium]|nr:haloacid dehalogenase [Chloroflexota bacterium]